MPGVSGHPYVNKKLLRSGRFPDYKFRIQNQRLGNPFGLLNHFYQKLTGGIPFLKAWLADGCDGGGCQHGKVDIVKTHYHDIPGDFEVVFLGGTDYGGGKYVRDNEKGIWMRVGV